VIDKKLTAEQCYQTALDNGFKFGDQFIAHNLSDAIGELFEGQRHIRDIETPWFYQNEKRESIKSFLDNPAQAYWFKVVYREHLENTVEMEIADCYMRMSSIGASLGSNYAPTSLSDYASQQISRCKTYDEFILRCAKWITRITSTPIDGGYSVEPSYVNPVLQGIEAWCDAQNIDLEWFVGIKMRYNLDREYLHGANSGQE
jgi:hypothetical protein